MVRYEKIDIIKLAELQCVLSGVELMEYTDTEKERGCRIIEKCIRELKEEMPTLIPAFNLFKLFPVKLPITISTDFTRLFFNPKMLINNRHLQYEKAIKYQLMHIIIHGLIGDNDLCKEEKKSKVLWLATDQKVDDICLKLGYKPADFMVAERIEYMKNNKPYNLCFGNYFLSKNNKYIKKKASSAWKSIASDNHEFWYPAYVKMMLGPNVGDDDSDEGNGEGNGTGYGGNPGREQSGKQGNGSSGNDWDRVRKLFMEGDGQDDAAKSKADEIAKSIVRKINSGSPNKGRGMGAGNEECSVTEAEGMPMDYKDIIRNILHQMEDPREVADSIDPMMYQFGLDTYGDVPLIEPKEGEEILKLDTVCVAIDTSGSCDGYVAQRFLRELKELLRELKGIATSGKLLMIQCDYVIQKEKEYELNEFFDEDAEELKMFQGWGGTRFTPVFNRLNDLNREDDRKVDALIYLTDGYGDFPYEEPEYPTVFVMPKEDAENAQHVPEWIQIGVIE